MRDKFSGVCCGGAGVFAFSSGASWFHRSGGHLELLPPDPISGSERSMLFFSVPRPLQTVQRAELRGLSLHYRHLGLYIMAWTMPMWLDMLVGFLLVENLVGPLELLVDGDLIALVQKLVSIRGPGTTAISKVKGHADEGLVRGGRVRELEKIGNDMADQAADLGRRRVGGCSCK